MNEEEEVLFLFGQQSLSFIYFLYILVVFITTCMMRAH